MASGEDKVLLMRRAQAAVLAHDWDAAVRLYKRLLDGDKNNIKALSLLGDVYVKKGDDNKASACYKQVLSLDKDNYDAMSALGGIYRRLSEYDESINVLQRALETHQDDVQTNYNMGFTYRRMEKWDEAIDCFKFVISENPNDVLAYNHLGAIYALQKDFEKSVEAYQRGLQIDPNHPVLNLNMARSLEAMGSREKANTAYQSALRFKPGWLEAVKSYSDFLVETKKTSQAADLVKKSILLHPEDVDMQSLLGRIYLKQSDYDNAAAAFEKAADIDENDLDAVRGLASAYEKSDRVEEALAAIKKAEDLSDEDDSVEKQYAHLLLTAGDVDDAGQKIRAVYDKNKKDPETLDLCGQYFVVRNEDGRARSAWKKINEADPNYKEHEKNAAARYKQIGKLDKAREYIEKYISENDDDPEGYIMLGGLEERAGNDDIARECYKLAVERDENNVLARNETSRLTIATKYGTRSNAAAPAPDPSSLSPSYAMNDDDDLFGEDLFVDDEKENARSDKDNLDIADKRAPDASGNETDSQKSETADDGAYQTGNKENGIKDEGEDDFWDDFEKSEEDEQREIETRKLVTDEDMRPQVIEVTQIEKAEEMPDEAIEEAEPAEKEEKPVQYIAPYPPPPPSAPSAEYTKALLEKMKDVAQKVWDNAQSAADSAQAADDALREIQEAREEQKEPEKEEAAEAEAPKEDDNIDADSPYSAELSLFYALRKICLTMLGNEEKDHFLHSRERVMLDYIIARLKGQKGLMNAAEAMAKRDADSGDGECGDSKAGSGGEKDIAPADVKAVIEEMRTLSHSLADASLTIALDRLASKVIDR